MYAGRSVAGLAWLAFAASLWVPRPVLAKDPVRAPVVHGPEVVLEVPWGTHGQAVGKDDGNESSPMGPMSFAVGPDGELFVLDQLNFRVLRFTPDGDLDMEFTLPWDTYQDLELAHDGALLVVDRLVQSSILVLDEAGAELGDHYVIGEGIPEGGGISATFVRDDGVWLEFAHTHVVRVLDELLAPCPETIRSGRILAGGETRVVASLDGNGGAVLRLEEMDSSEVRAEQTLSFRDRIDRIIWIEADRRGHIVVMLHMWPIEGDAAARAGGDYVVGIVYDQQLRAVDTFRSPYAIVIWEQFREFKVTPDGHIYQMAFTDGGMRILRWSLK